MKIRRKHRTSKAHGFLWVLFAIFMSGCLLASALAITIIVKGDEWLEDLPPIDEAEIMKSDKTSTVYAADGTTVLAEFQLQNRQPVDSLDNISIYVVKGTVDTEDNRFYDHNGVDLIGIARALVVNVFGGELEGASTITQQLVRNTLISSEAKDISIKRKIREIKLSLDIEEMYSKEQILLMYLNTINYGDGAYGIQAASQHYFSKNANELTIAEAATLIGIPQSPTYLNPTEYPEACVERRNLVLNRMLTAGTITKAEYDENKNAELVLNLSVTESINGIYKYGYFTSYVRDLILDEYTSAELYEGGWTIYTTLDVKSQDAAEYACNAQYGKMTDGLECALAAVDTHTGAILAIVGGKDYTVNQFNIATQKGRPTGSSFKTFTLVTAIEQGIDPQTLIDCTKSMEVTTDTGTVTVSNYENRDYGIRSIASGIAVSSNTGLVRLQQQVGTTNVIKTAHDLGVTQENLPNVPVLTLGVADITPLDMASAYATIANGGTYHEPYAIESIIDNRGQTIYQHEVSGSRVISESVAGATTDVLKGVLSSGGTASSARLAGGREAAGKTGTTDDYKDHWMVGYTPSLSAAVWIGDRNNVLSSRNSDNDGTWKLFMDAALADTEKEKFPSYTAPTYDNPFNERQNKELSQKDPNTAPNVVGMESTAAQETLKEYKVSIVQESSDTVAQGLVISQSVSDKTIILHVSKGAS